MDKKSPKSLWAELNDKLPWQNNPESMKRRDDIWRLFDANSNGYLSLAEVEKAMRDVL